MTELQFLREKYHNKDFIEITSDIQMKVFEWLSSGKLSDGQMDIRKQTERLCERGFIKFLKEGIILVHPSNTKENLRLYPFQFTDDNHLIISVYITKYGIREEDQLGLLCKVKVSLDTHYEVIDGTFNDELALEHFQIEMDTRKDNLITNLQPIIRLVRENNPDLIPDSQPWREEVFREYYRNVIKAQIIGVIAINTYLSVLQKDILITKITQQRELKAGNSGGRKGKVQMNYRYQVQLPPNYKPRKFNLNYILSEWQRSAHVATRWVRKENAELLAKRKGGRVIGMTKGEYVSIEIPIQPQVVHRRKVTLPDNKGTKTYT